MEHDRIQYHPEQLLPEKEAATFLSVSVRQMFNLRTQGLIAFVPVGRNIKYRMADLVQFIQRMRSNGGSALS